uniref:Uncharacterized protein n=1 Tax=Romanomermis culicivorax TaxID=13658 RepID=A0A915HXI3_ROMCU
MVTTLSLTSLPARTDLTVSGTLINKFLKLTLDDISSLAPVPEEMATPVHQTEMDTEPDTTTTLDHTLTNIPEGTTTNNKSAMDLIQPSLAMDPLIYLAMPAALATPPMIASVAAARKISGMFVLTCNT